jgi:Pin2-interacting protein X1
MAAGAEKESEDVPVKYKKKRKEEGKDKKSTESLKKSTPDGNGNQLNQNSSRRISEEAVESKPKKSKKRRKQTVDSAEEIDAPLQAVLDEKQRIKKKKKTKELREHSESMGANASTEGEPRVKSQSSTSVTPDGSSTPQALLGGRHAVRSRNIAQKRLAVLDTASLNQVSIPIQCRHASNH